jgi:ribosomal protein S18 acetylase RimI-like enzyme
MPDRQRSFVLTEWALREAPVIDLTRLERTYDALPRVGGARVEAVGPFELFLGEPYPYYARPRLGSALPFTAAHVAAVRARQRELGVPEAIEWVHEMTLSLIDPVRESGLPVTEAPLMVLDPAGLPSPGSARLLDPSAEDFAADYAASRDVARIAFGGAPGGPVAPELLAYVAAGIAAGHKAEAVLATTEEGIVSRGGLQSALGVAEIVGVATLPTARRRGFGAAVSALLARTAMSRGNDVVFLSAASEDVARVYAGIGFRRVGTAMIAEAH